MHDVKVHKSVVDLLIPYAYEGGELLRKRESEENPGNYWGPASD